MDDIDFYFTIDKSKHAEELMHFVEKVYFSRPYYWYYRAIGYWELKEDSLLLNFEYICGLFCDAYTALIEISIDDKFKCFEKTILTFGKCT